MLSVEKVSAERSEISAVVDEVKSLISRDNSLDVYDDKSEIILQGESCSICLSPGDGVMYKGCERPHWRDPLPSRHVGNCYAELPDDTYYHQVFFHYVLADGNRVHCANDMSN